MISNLKLNKNNNLKIKIKNYGNYKWPKFE